MPAVPELAEQPAGAAWHVQLAPGSDPVQVCRAPQAAVAETKKQPPLSTAQVDTLLLPAQKVPACVQPAAHTLQDSSQPAACGFRYQAQRRSRQYIDGF